VKGPWKGKKGSKVAVENGENTLQKSDKEK
jgi:hypothetical protein